MLLVGVLLGLSASVAASVLAPTHVNQATNQYAAGSDGINGYSAATISVTTVPVGVTTCTSGTKTISTIGGSTNLVFSSATGGTSCTAGDYAEEFSIGYSVLLVTTQTNTFGVTTKVGGGLLGTNSEIVVVGTGLPLPFSATVHIFIDYGSTLPPAGGVSVLDLVIQ
ncbi:MAG: hypothetical protein L3K10_03460 [Thermoplasmata archaeon]|nr:hypothetical protein [Thermoplasmata archaeon]